MTKEGIYLFVAREGTVTAIMTKNEDGPHEESGKEPKKREIGSVVFSAMCGICDIV